MHAAVFLDHEATMEIGGSHLLPLLLAREDADGDAGAGMQRLGVALQGIEMRGREGAEEAAAELQIGIELLARHQRLEELEGGLAVLECRDLLRGRQAGERFGQHQLLPRAHHAAGARGGAATERPAIQHHHIGAAARGLQRRGEAGEAAADDGDIGTFG